MKRLLERIHGALLGVARAPAPPPVAPSGGADLDGDHAEIFTKELERARGRVVRVPDEAAAQAWIARTYADGTTTCLVEDDPTEAVVRASEVGIDRADVLIAETGTIVRSYASRREARVSLVPPTTVFLARCSDLVRDLPTALARLADAHREGRAYSILVTGPSRTADIEKQLVIPAHGPRELIVLLIDDQR